MPGRCWPAPSQGLATQSPTHCNLATKETQVNHEVGEAGPRALLLQQQELHPAEQAN